MLKSMTLSLAMMLFAAFAIAVPADAATVKARAEVSGGQALKFKAEYREKVKQGVTSAQRLQIKVKHAMPLQTLDVAVNGQVVGTITTNVAGRGKLRLKAPKDVVPAILSGDVISVGPASATFFTKADKYKVHGQISAEGSTVVGIVKYHQKPHKGILDRRFMVNIEGAFAGEVFDVTINGVFVGQITADEFGEGQLKLRTAEFPGDGWQDLPIDFPTLHAGDTVSVGSIVVTLH